MAKSRRKPGHTAAGLEIIEAFIEFREILRSGDPIESRVVVHDIEPDFQASDYAPEDVRRIREDILNVSQAVFARFLGVSVKTVQSWERGSRPANPTARRFMDEIAAAPQHWRNRVKQRRDAMATVARP